ncbi:Taurine-transporting ATPase [Methanobacterium lacus]|jgi:NitT/TauT family transport system ATP-binding protein|uniref:Molybdate/tungstate import ATP-binding protein WtpC n=1 Tax=Methanobacterium lacus (strain AL-21) TaxID=877455 RepID=F0T9D5_METLA|nr:ABC transporter ATP-binding protein [Methanobacterium lacus]ADZ09886.1 Taurine-transporting ATPase [Methanobacterium lacus]
MVFKIKKVNKNFQNKTMEMEILKDIDLTIEDGEFLVLLGPSGCGKTTLLRMIAGLDFPTTGTITENDVPVLNPSPERGFVFQQYSLFPWRTVLDNVAFGLEVNGIDEEERYEKAKNYIEMVGLSAFLESYPNQLSGGMKQRVAIARALVNEPNSLLMDEPFAALDVLSRHKLQKEIIQIWEQETKTIIFVTHNVDEAVFLADRILVFSERPGRIIETFNIEQERIRDRTSEEYLAIKRKITGLLETNQKF